ncbi:MAG: DMT family transporter [Prevotella sp.]|nr:DMT family transporter [Prevotella sp.]
MQYLGELISLGVAFSWTISALFGEVGSRKLGVSVMNVWRMMVALLLSAVLLWVTMGTPYPAGAGNETWGWLLASGVVGYFLGDMWLLNCYVQIGSRMGQLLMTLAPMFTAMAAWIMIGQELSWTALLAMGVTLTGIAISVLGHDEHHHVAMNLPLKGVLYGIGAALGQGVGLVLSKIGLDHYTQDVGLSSPHLDVLPFASNSIRCVAGLVFFSAWLVISGKAGKMRDSLHERRGLLAMLIAVFAGPFVGVGFSLMAVQYTAAGIASTIMAMSPILILLPSKWLFHQPITARNVIGAIISVIGVSLFFLLDSGMT